MDLSLPIVYHGLTCQPLTIVPGGGAQSGIVITRADPSQTPADFRADKLPLADGVNLSDVYLSGRPITLTADVYGTSKGQMWDLVESWLAAFSPRNPSTDDDLEFSQPTADLATWTAGVIPLFVNATPIKQPWYRALDRKDDDAGGHVMQVGAELLATDPYKYVQTGLSDILDGTLTAITYRGNAYHTNGHVNIEINSNTILGSPPSALTIGWKASSADTEHSVILDLSAQTAEGTYVLSLIEKYIYLYPTTYPLSGIISSASVFPTIGPSGLFRITGSNSRIEGSPVLYYYEGFY